ncbi:MAG: hypothetical protein HIU91_01185 [Acidobacteria bacterium]|nr:hypothetical protein [Acidobacteriota bacterium]
MSLRVRTLLVVCLVGILTYTSRHYVIDDALIYFRYMRNALDGLGLVFNPGEHINALTSPLYTYVLLLVSWMVRGDVHLAASLIFAITLMGACVLAERQSSYAGLVIASMGYFYSLVGMETPLLLFLLVLALALLLDDRVNWLPLVLILLLLTRAEAGAMIPACAIYMYRNKRWPSLLSYLPAVAIAVLYLIINHHFYGAYLPTSSTAKLDQARSGYWGRWPTAFLHLRVLWTESKYAPYTMPFLGIAGAVGLYRTRRSMRTVVLLTFAAILICFYVGANIPNYHWYYAPLLFVLALYAVVPFHESRRGEVFLALLIVAQGVTTVIVRRTPEARRGNYQKAAEWLNEHASPSATVETAEIGEIGWASHRKVLDIIGLTEPKNAEHIAHRDVTSWLKEDRPDYVVVHRDPWVFERVAAHSPEYERVPFMSGDVYLLRRKESTGGDTAH